MTDAPVTGIGRAWALARGIQPRYQLGPSDGVPLFPAGVVKPYTEPKSFIDNLDLTEFAFLKYNGQSTFREDKFSNILLWPKFEEIRIWVEECAKDYLDNVLELEYEEFFLTSSWVNIMSKGGYQSVHNHANSIISGVLYLKSEPGHPPLKFIKYKMETRPFISLGEHYKKINPNTATTLSFPCIQDDMFIFNSYMTHGHDVNELESERVGIAWNGLVNFVEKDEDLYRIRFVKKET